MVAGALTIAACGGGGSNGGSGASSGSNSTTSTTSATSTGADTGTSTGANVGGVSSGSLGGCPSTTVYGDYGFNATYVYGEIGFPATVTFGAHVLSGCTVPQKLEGALPPGMSFDTMTGKISGTPTAGGIYAVTVHPDVADWQEVRSGVTLEIQPVGRQTDTVTPSQLTPLPLPDMHFDSSIAVATHGTSTRVWAGGVRMLVGNYVLYTTVDDGAHWTTDDAGGLIRPRGDTYGTYKLAAYDTVAYVLDTGGTLGFAPMPSVLYGFDGTGWGVRNQNLPFRAPGGAAMVAMSATSLAVAWSDSQGISLWTSGDGGLNWVKNPATGGFTPGFLDHEGVKLCLGQAGGDWHATALVSAAWTQATLLAGATTWDTSVWPWGHYATPFTVCASDGDRFWVAGTGGVVTTENFLKLSNAAAGELSTAFPRRVASIGSTGSGTIFDSMGSASGHLYGLVAPPNGHNTYVIWKLR